MGRKAPVRGGRILVTGGCGFIGSHVVERLIQDGAREVVVLDNLRTGSRSNLPPGDVRVIEHSLGADSSEVLERELRGVDLLFHLAAEKHAQARVAPVSVLESNVIGTHQLLAAAARHGVCKVVFASSLYAYGRTSAPPMSEDERPEPTTVYGTSKLAGEHLLASMRRQSGLDFVALRYFFVYGPKQYPGLGYKSVIIRNFERLLAGKPPTIFGDGEQILDYVFIDDAVDAAVRAMETSLSGDILNVGSGEATTINALIDKMIAVTGRPAEKIHMPPDETAGSYRVSRIDRIRKALGWRPTTTLDEGLRRTYAWMKTRGKE
jgi:UDP-glucose 4-epimerase